MLIRVWGLLIFLFCAGLPESAAQFRDSGSNIRQSGTWQLGHVESRATDYRLPPTVTASATSARKALLLSFLLPGLGNRYVNGGSWGGTATVFAAIDVGLWAALIGGEWRRNHLEDSYTTLAASSAHADVQGKDRTFFLNLATYRSSREFLETALRNRAWDQIEYVEDISFQWNWSTESDFERFRSLREDAESLRRRRVVIVASLVANRLISGLTAARKAGRTEVQLALGPPPGSSSTPSARVYIRF